MKAEQYWSTELERLENDWRAGNFNALLEVVLLCGDERPLPSWASMAVSEQLDRAINGNAPTAGERAVTSGRSGGTRSRMEQDAIHSIRWTWARWALGGNISNTPSGRREARKEMGIRNKEEAFERVSEMLRGSAGQGSAATIEESYKLVEKAIKSGDGRRFTLE